MELKTEYSRTVNFGDDIDIDIIQQSLIFNNMDSCMGNNVHIKFNKLFMEIPFFLSCIFGNHLFEKDDNKICLNTKLFLKTVYLDDTHNAHNFKKKLIDHIMDFYLPELNADTTSNGLVVEYNKITKEEQLKNVDINTNIQYNSKDFYNFDQTLVIEYNKLLKDQLSTNFAYGSQTHNPLSNINEIKYTYPDNEFYHEYHSLGKFINKDKLTSYVYPTITKLLQDLLMIYDTSLDDQFMTITYYTKGWFQFYIRKLEDYAKINTAALLYHTILNKVLNKMTKNNHIFDTHSSSDINQKYFRILSQFSVFFKKLQSDSVETTTCNKLFFYVKENTFNEDNIPTIYKTNNKIKQDIRYFDMDDEKLVYKDKKYPFSQEYIDKTLSISKDKGAFFTNEVEPQILSGLLSISNIIKNNENCVLFSFGYSGVGKTTNIFGGDEKTKNTSLMNMIMMNVKDTHDIEVNISDYYGIKLNEKEPNVFVMSFEKNAKGVINEITFNEVAPVFITIKNVDELKTLTDGVDSIRKNKGHIVKTSNNPNSSRSFIVYKFRFTQKQSKQENFLYVFDMPGVENPSLDSESDLGSTPSTSHFNMLFQNSGGILEPIENIITNLYCDISGTEEYSNIIPDIVERQSNQRITFNEELFAKTTEQYNHKKNNHLSSKLIYLDIVNSLLNITFSMSDTTTMYWLEAYNIQIKYNDIYDKISLLFENLSEQERDQHIINYIVYDFNKKVQVSNFDEINDDGIKTYLTKQTTNLNSYPNLEPLWKYLRSESLSIPSSTINSKKILTLNEKLIININDKHLEEYYNKNVSLASSEAKAKVNINQIIKKKLFLKGLKNFDYSDVYGSTGLVESIQDVSSNSYIPFISTKDSNGKLGGGAKYFKQYLEGEFINHTLNVLSNDMYSEISSICYKKERTNDGELLNYIKKVIEQTSYVVNFFVVSNYNMNSNLIAALEKNAQANVNGTNPANYRKYIYDTQFNILDTFKKYFDEV
jgi:hypothetical protein